MTQLINSAPASGTGSVTIAAPVTNSTRTITLPDATTTVVGTDTAQTLTNKIIQGGALTLATAQTASGSSVDFTGIPAWVKQITVMLSGVSLSGTDSITLQLGDSGGLETTGYVGNVFITYDGGSINVNAFSLWFTLTPAGGGTAAGNVYSGQAILSLLDSTTNTWVINGSFSPATTAATARISLLSGGKSLSATLDRLSISRSGTDTFDAGSINIMYEG